MKNADMPAMPFTPTQDRHNRTPGLTKREHMAQEMAAANRAACPGNSALEIARMAVIDADALLAELEKTE